MLSGALISGVQDIRSTTRDRIWWASFLCNETNLFSVANQFLERGLKLFPTTA